MGHRHPWTKQNNSAYKSQFHQCMLITRKLYSNYANEGSFSLWSVLNFVREISKSRKPVVRFARLLHICPFKTENLLMLSHATVVGSQRPESRIEGKWICFSFRIMSICLNRKAIYLLRPAQDVSRGEGRVQPLLSFFKLIVLLWKEMAFRVPFD